MAAGKQAVQVINDDVPIELTTGVVIIFRSQCELNEHQSRCKNTSTRTDMESNRKNTSIPLLQMYC